MRISSQSETAKPLNPNSPLRIFVSKFLFMCPGIPLTDPELIITERAPAATAALKLGKNNSFICRSGIHAGVRSLPEFG